MLKVTGIVTLVADVDIAFKNETSKLIEFRGASNRSVKVKEEWVEKATFVTIKAWLHVNSKLPDYLKKGQQVGISADLIQENWETPEGEKRSKLVLEIINGSIQLIGGKKEGTAANTVPAPDAATPTPAAATPAATPAAGTPDIDINEDEIPF